MTVTLTVVVPTRQVLTHNQRLHWAALAKRRAHLRQLGALTKRRDIPDVAMDAAHCLVELGFSDTRDRDPNNWEASTKPMIDGIVNGPTHRGDWAYGLLPDDDARYLTGPDHRISDTKSRRGVVRFDFTFTDLGEA